MENSLIFQNTPKVTIATNTFVHVPIILRYEDFNLIEIVKEKELGFTTQIPIYHKDGTYLAKAKGNRLYLTDEGEKAGLSIEKYVGLWVCRIENQTLFEIQQQVGDSFKTTAELYTPDGYFVKCSDFPTPVLIDNTGNELKIAGNVIAGNTIVGAKVGIWLRADGALSIGT